MLSAAYFEDGSDLDEGTMSILSDANYLLVTNPARLFDVMVPREDADTLLVKGATLASLKTGVVAFLDPDDPFTSSSGGVRFILNNMADDLHPRFRTNGYIAILGENYVIPTGIYPVTGSDQDYTNLEGGDLPNIIVGRFIGDSVSEIMPQLDTAIGMARGELVNDPTGSALLISGGYNGEEAFLSNTEDLRVSIEPKMDSVTTHHIHELLNLSTMELDLQVLDGWMAAGDLDGDGKGEVAVLDLLNSSVQIIHPDTEARETHSISGVLNGRILAAQIDEDPELEIIILNGIGSGTQPVGSMKVYDQPFTLLWTRQIIYGIGSEACVLDFDDDGLDEVAVTEPDTDEIHILSRTGQLLETIAVNHIRTFARIGFADMNGDGYGDFIICDDQRVLGYAGPDWTRFYLLPNWNGFPSTSGFTAGDIGSDGGGRFVIIHPDSAGSTISSYCYRYSEEHGWETYYGAVSLMAFAVPPVALTHAEMMGDGGPPELVLISNGLLRIIDLERIPDRFRDLISPEMPGKDIIFYRDHGSETEWISVINSSSMANISFDSSIHRPVIFGSACSTGNFVETDDSFAEACMKAGAGVYIGATIPSYRNLNNFASRMIKDFVNGTPIGLAFREVERSLIDRGSRCWADKYNLYGDPAFGTDGRPVTLSRVNTLKLFHMIRSQGSIELNVAEPEFRETGEGLQAVLEG
ncbi:MAG TPA: hypothetical protein ENK47_00760, partial [Euryarchaeota archaeon]|nr:hypothetical protein [Euryarchaeota archaeon]